MKLFKKKSRNIEGVERKVATDDAVLMVLVDKYIPNFQKYMCDRGINVSNVYRSIEDAKVGMFMNSSCCRLIIIETGIGVFTTTKARAELTDLLGIADGINWFISVFYTDSIIKSENSRKIKNVDWYEYSTVGEMIKQLIQYKEKYVMDGDLVEEVLPEYDEAVKLKFDELEVKSDVVLSADKELVDNDMIDIVHNREEYYAKEQLELERRRKIDETLEMNGGNGTKKKDKNKKGRKREETVVDTVDDTVDIEETSDNVYYDITEEL